MAKFMRVKEDTFLWQKGAILEDKDGGYRPVEDIWNTTKVNGGEYISSRIVEAEENARFFERVYPVTIGGKIYKTKDQVIATYNAAFKQ